jgi:chromosome partitioning protein
MYVIVVASQKGGAGKTTLIRNLAVATHQQFGATAILDTDPQGSLTSWWNRREDQQPALLKLDMKDFGTSVGRLADAGLQYLFVDTPPSVHPEIRELLAHADLVIVPVRPSPDDLDAVGDTLGLIEEASRPFVFVLTQAKPRTRLQMQAVLALAKHGKLAPTVIHDRTDFPTAAISGKAVTEIEPETASAREIKEVLEYVMTQLRKHAATQAAEGRP